MAGELLQVLRQLMWHSPAAARRRRPAVCAARGGKCYRLPHLTAWYGHWQPAGFGAATWVEGSWSGCKFGRHEVAAAGRDYPPAGLGWCMWAGRCLRDPTCPFCGSSGPHLQRCPSTRARPQDLFAPQCEVANRAAWSARSHMPGSNGHSLDTPGPGRRASWHTMAVQPHKVGAKALAMKRQSVAEPFLHRQGIGCSPVLHSSHHQDTSVRCAAWIHIHGGGKNKTENHMPGIQ